MVISFCLKLKIHYAASDQVMWMQIFYVPAFQRCIACLPFANDVIVVVILNVLQFKKFLGESGIYVQEVSITGKVDDLGF